MTIVGSADAVLAALPQSACVDLTILPPFIANTFIIGQNGKNVQLTANSDTQLAALFGGASFGSNPALGSSLTFTGGVKAAYAQSAGASSLVGGGGTVGTGTASGGASGLQLMNDTAGATHPFGYVRRVTLWITKLADATLQGFTNP